MAYNDSGELLASQSTYSLGGYTFELKVQTVHEPGEPDVVSVFAICRGPDGTRETQAVDFTEGTVVENWYVEANETEASVYVKTSANIQPLETTWDQPIKIGGAIYSHPDIAPTYRTVVQFYDNAAFANAPGGTRHIYMCASAAPGTFEVGTDTLYYPDGRIQSQRVLTLTADNEYTYNGKTVYHSVIAVSTGGGVFDRSENSNTPWTENITVPETAWMMIYGEEVGPNENEKLIARFAIDIREADGGPDGDWDEPGDTGDPSYTLNVSVTGASSGSNNETPLEPGQTGGYGNGGTGGNGGGGGAGASTVIIYEFATDKAGTVNQEATAQGPGTGGPGGKGGKGSDGCILIFY